MFLMMGSVASQGGTTSFKFGMMWSSRYEYKQISNTSARCNFVVFYKSVKLKRVQMSCMTYYSSTTSINLELKVWKIGDINPILTKPFTCYRNVTTDTFVIDEYIDLNLEEGIGYLIGIVPPTATNNIGVHVCKNGIDNTKYYINESPSDDIITMKFLGRTDTTIPTLLYYVTQVPIIDNRPYMMHLEGEAL